MFLKMDNYSAFLLHVRKNFNFGWQQKNGSSNSMRKRVWKIIQDMKKNHILQILAMVKLTDDGINRYHGRSHTLH